MPGLYIANEDLTITKVPNGSWTPNNATYTTIKATEAKENQKKVLINQISWTMAGCSLTSYTFISGGGSMTATANKCKADSNKCMRLSDHGTCHGTFNLTASPFTPLSCTCEFTITDAGQSKAKGE